MNCDAVFAADIAAPPSNETIVIDEKPSTPSSVDSSQPPWSCGTDIDTSIGTSSDSESSQQTDQITQMLDELLDQISSKICLNESDFNQTNGSSIVETCCEYSSSSPANMLTTVDIIHEASVPPSVPVPVKSGKNKKFAAASSAAKVDIFGHTVAKIRKLSVVCPNCSRNLAASRLAPHLEKCLGMGRNSSRVASRRITDYIKSGTASD